MRLKIETEASLASRPIGNGDEFIAVIDKLLPEEKKLIGAPTLRKLSAFLTSTSLRLPGGLSNSYLLWQINRCRMKVRNGLLITCYEAA
jgi:hypothetical protein